MGSVNISLLSKLDKNPVLVIIHVCIFFIEDISLI